MGRGWVKGRVERDMYLCIFVARLGRDQEIRGFISDI